LLQSNCSSIRKFSDSTKSNNRINNRIINQSKALLGYQQEINNPKSQQYSSTTMTNEHALTTDNINQNAIRMEYAVRGPIVIRAGEIERQLRDGISPGNFDKVIRANIGDCHATGQKPLTFIRQVIACATENSLLENSSYPADVKERVKLLLSYCGGKSAGAYSESTGIEIVRRHVADYIKERDGFDSDWQNIVLSGGASEVIRSLLSLVNNQQPNEKLIGVMIPIPQYPLYSATIAEYGMHQISYYLDEDKEWSLDINELERSLNESRAHCKPRVLVVINPGNPTGSILSKENIVEIIKFARRNNLMIIADEVYQHNIYAQGAQFHSFKKVMSELGIELELASCMSLSKGYMGECGLRGGYGELVNFDPQVKAIFYKMLSAKLCCSVLGQIGLDCIVNPPKAGDPSYELFKKEKEAVLNSLKKKAEIVANTFNSIPGIKCNKVAGAMYAFPKIDLPEKAIKKAESLGQKPDFFYAMKLLETTGICIVPGSGFGQIPGTYHFRTTILPPEEQMQDMMTKFTKFHSDFIEEFK